MWYVFFSSQLNFQLDSTLCLRFLLVSSSCSFLNSPPLTLFTLCQQPSSSTSDVKPVVGLGSVAPPQASHNEVATSKQPRKGRKAIAEKTVGPAKTTKKAPKAAAARFDP